MGHLDLTYGDFLLMLSALENLKDQTKEFLHDARYSRKSSADILMAKSLEKDCNDLIRKIKKSSES